MDEPQPRNLSVPTLLAALAGGGVGVALFLLCYAVWFPVPQQRLVAFVLSNCSTAARSWPFIGIPFMLIGYRLDLHTESGSISRLGWAWLAVVAITSAFFGGGVVAYWTLLAT